MFLKSGRVCLPKVSNPSRFLLLTGSFLAFYVVPSYKNKWKNTLLAEALLYLGSFALLTSIFCFLLTVFFAETTLFSPTKKYLSMECHCCHLQIFGGLCIKTEPQIKQVGEKSSFPFEISSTLIEKIRLDTPLNVAFVGCSCIACPFW